MYVYYVLFIAMSHVCVQEDQKKASPSLLRVLVKMHMKDIAVCHMQKILSDLILLCSPLLLGS